MKGKVNLNLQTLVLVLASVLVLSSIGFENSAFALGDAPSTCTNRYDGSIVSFTINNASQTFDAIANPGVTFNVNTFGSYNVAFVIHTTSTSSQGNSDPGTTWYRSTALGFANGICLPDRTTTSISPNQDVTVNVSYSHPGNFASQGPQPVEFSTFSTLSSLITYNVNWINPPQTTSQLTVNSQDNNGNTVTGFFTTLSQNGNQISTGFTPASFTLNNTQTYTVNVEDFGKYVFDHWLDNGSTDANRIISISSDTQITAVYKTVPQPPTGLTATAQILQTDLSWNAPSDNGGSAITGYMIERSTDNGNTWSVLVANTGSTGTTYSDTSVFPLTTYTYRVSAINDVGTSDPSNTASATTPTVGPVTPPSLP